MGSQDFKQIIIEGHLVGIIGLQEALEQFASKFKGDVDYARLKKDLLAVLKRKNYIPEKAEQQYAEAFLREFKKFIGHSYEQKASAEAIDIKVLGPGCTQCDRLEKELIDVMAETGMTATIEHVRDINEIGKYGVLGTPALLINGEVKCVGSVPPKAKLLKWLEEAKT